MPRIEKVQIPVVMGCVIRDDTVLMVRRHSPSIPELHGKWELPGGKIRFTEDYISACEREIREETGVHTKAIRMLPIPYSAVRNLEGKIIHALVVCFQCEFIGQTSIGKLDHNIDDITWIKINELHPLNTQAGTLFFINYIQQKKTALGRLGSAQTYHGAIRLARIDSSKNIHRKYTILIETINKQNAFSIQCTWGRIDTKGVGHEKQTFSSERDLLRDLSERLKKRLSHQYKLVEISGNVPYIDTLDKFERVPEEKSLFS